MVGGLTGDFDYQFSGKIIVIPDFATVSPFCIGFTPDPATWITAIPYAITAWIIAYGDFITVQELGFAAVREDEHIEFALTALTSSAAYVTLFFRCALPTLHSLAR